MLRRRETGASPPAAPVRLLVAAFLLWASAVGAFAQGPAIQDLLGAGEFGPALAAARQIPDAARRDAALAQIALAQAQAGARDSSLETAGRIADDRVRARAFADVGAQPLGGRGGAAMADFDSLIDLIVSTVAPDTWDDVGGVGSIAPFPTGVWVDPEGVMRPLVRRDDSGELAALREASRARAVGDDVRRAAKLRKVSLPRLERQVQRRLAAGRPPSEAMRVLAGLERIEYVFVYPQSGDLVLAGPAGDWRADGENRILSVRSGRPVVRLDDLVVVFRHVMSASDARFGCLIKPRQEGLARVNAMLAEPVSFQRPGDRKAWIERLRSTLGTQDIEFYGLDPRTRAARVMIEADYRMKLVGMGLEEGVPGVKSYLELVDLGPGEAPPAMDVLRWWFTLNYDALVTTGDRGAFAVCGQGVQVQSENEFLTAQGQRVHTGQSEPLNRQFAASFTEHFDALARRYPVYAELRNLCDLALVAALMREEDLPGQVGWHMTTTFALDGAYPLELGAAPKSVETVANYRVIRSGKQVHTLGGVSGGVRVDPSPVVAKEAIETQQYGALSESHHAARPEDLPADAWWWD